jgi:DNA uptake protein ComE-like DNA-binding protein
VIAETAAKPDCGIVLRMVRILSAAAAIFLMAGCAPSNTQSLQQHTADATAAAKRDAGAVVRGVQEGLERKGPVNINTATARELGKLRGVTPEQAAAIVEHRPYRSTRDLVTKRVMAKAEYDTVKNQIVVD